ncbi:hypothetical protein ACQKKX_19295 [Neorhizobium sp. NPDC001467]|uniref:hypothetical protein n=1 Tax=Neorhizobium sp. NPDC001467 TaxID=3390595 RepID=UPI003CFF377D
MSVPIALFSVLGYEINPAFFLAPLVAVAFLFAFPNRYVIAFTAAAVGGAVSVLVANYADPQNVVKSALGLLLMLIAPSFFFLGRWIGAKRCNLERLCFWLALFSVVFLLPVTIRLLFNGEPVRAYIGVGYAVLNAQWFGLPVFASFGVLSLAYLICLQMFILAGAMTRVNRMSFKAIFFIGLSAAVFLVMGSDSRFAQMCIAWLAITAVGYWIFRRESLNTALVLLAIAIGVGGTLARISTVDLRLYQTATTIISNIGTEQVSKAEAIDRKIEQKIEETVGPQANASSLPPSELAVIKKEAIVEVEKEHTVADITTGRGRLFSAGLEELSASPIIGNGFNGYGRFSPNGADQILSANTSTHVYYLTIFWKGGLIFGLPLLAFLLMAARDGFNNRAWATGVGFYITSMVALAFGPMALTWDILYVPSAGALAWLLFGVLAGGHHDAGRHQELAV